MVQAVGHWHCGISVLLSSPCVSRIAHVRADRGSETRLAVAAMRQQRLIKPIVRVFGLNNRRRHGGVSLLHRLGQFARWDFIAVQECVKLKIQPYSPRGVDIEYRSSWRRWMVSAHSIAYFYVSRGCASSRSKLWLYFFIPRSMKRAWIVYIVA